MDPFGQDRRSLLFVLSALSMDQMSPQNAANGQGKAKQGYVLGSTEGEHLVHFRDLEISSSNSALSQVQEISPWEPSR